ncbi:MAG: carbohydrate binding family 9 domain-containing protein [Bacteroidetes bacterium]|nr:carbohydrate binding family 9 domain-containing protein [Bacteroidota bacterium]
MHKLNLLFLVFFYFTLTHLTAQTTEKRKYQAARTVEIPELDGNINDNCWTKGEWQGDFVQHEPREGMAPSQKTEFCILYDNSYLYVAFKAYDTAPDSIVKRMTRRDQADGDQVGIVFDSFHDLRTGFDFSVSASGVKQDVIYSEDGNIEDETWDPIWYVKTAMYEWGWAAEMKIPFTQLRFNAGSEGVWGLNVARQIFRFSELSLWQATPRDASGFIHFMGENEWLVGPETQKTV